MDDLVINLDEYQKISKSGRILNILLGISLMGFCLFFIWNKIAKGEGFWDYFIFVVFLFLGLSVLLFTFGIFYKISRRYVILNSKGVDYKLSLFYPSRSIAWDDMKKVEIRTLRILFHTGKHSYTRIKLGEIYYNDIKKLKQNLAEFCIKKGITWTDTTVESELAGKENKREPS